MANTSGLSEGPHDKEDFVVVRSFSLAAEGVGAPGVFGLGATGADGSLRGEPVARWAADGAVVAAADGVV
jgi:hypothetical protein